MMPKNANLDIKGMALLILLCASWGFNQVVIKVTIEYIPPVLQAGLRSVGAAACVFLWMRLRGNNVWEKDGTLWWGIIAGLMFSAEFVFIYWGLEYTTASRATVFLNTAPFTVALGAQLFIPGEKLGKAQVTGLCLAFAGIVVAFNESLNLPTRQILLGDIMLVSAAVIWGATTVVIKAGPLASIAPSKTLLYQLAVSAVVLPAASVLFGESGFRDLTLLAVSGLLYQMIWIAFATYLIWFWLISNYAVSRMSSFTFLAPLFGVMFGGLILGDPLSISLLTALCLVGAGIYLVNRR